MRCLGLIPALLLVACSTDNDLFVLTQPSGGGATDSSSGDPPSSSPTSTAPPTSDSGDPSSGSATTGGGGSAEESATTAVSASEPPGTTTGDDTTTTSDPSTGVDTENETGGPVCKITHAEGLDLQVRNKTKGGEPYTDCDGESRTFVGHLNITGAELRVHAAGNCETPLDGDEMIVAKLPNVQDMEVQCAEVKILWNHEQDGCTVGTLSIRDQIDPGKKLLLLGRFSHEFPFQLPFAPEMPELLFPCGCMDEQPNCCAPVDAGEYGFSIFGQGPIPPTKKSEPFMFGDMDHYVLHNVQAWVGPACVETGDYRFDWFAQITEP